MSYFNEIKIADSPSVDAFRRLRVSEPTTIFDAQFTYDLNSLLLQAVTNGTGATITHDATNRWAELAFSSTPTGGKSFLQTYEHFRYQPGKSQQAIATFNMQEKKANALKFAGLSDGVNGIEFQLDGTTVQMVLYSGTDAGNQIVAQADWNEDTLLGTGGSTNPSGVTLDISKVQILVIDLQALYAGRVRVGFDIHQNNNPFYVHEFRASNLLEFPYIQTANLPVRCGMTCTGTVSTSMNFLCSAVISEGGVDESMGYPFTAQSSLSPISAASGARTHFVSVQPRTTFNSIVNRAKIILDSVDILVTGDNPVFWELCLGQAFTTEGTTTNVNADYSVMDVVTGTLSGNPVIVMDSGFINATATSKGKVTEKVNIKYPITLDVNGAVRTMGRVTILLTGLGGASNAYAQLKWREIR